MKVAVGCDPNATDLKLEIIDELDKMGIEVKDFGSDDPIYANVVFEVGKAVAGGTYDRGVVLCGTGIGASIAANKVPGVYCALATDTYQAERAQLSNNANVIALGAQVTGSVIARQIVRTYMSNTFQPGSRSEPKVMRIVEFAEKHNS